MGRWGLWTAAAIGLAAVAAPGRAAGTFEPRGSGGAAMLDPATLGALRQRVLAAASEGPARIGLAAIDTTTGQMVSVNGARPFPMASTVKVAIAAAFLHGVEAGRLGLDRFYALPAAERRKAARTGDMGSYRASLSGGELIERMLTRSDNAAADILLGAIGGTRVVADWLVAAGVDGQRVDRSIVQLLSDHEMRKRLRVGRGRHRRWITVSVPVAAPAGDNRDSSTPEAMAALLVKLRDGQLLDRARTAYLFDVMARCRTGARRLRGMLPEGTPVAHKTGTLNGVTDDVGVVTLPNGHDLVVAAFVNGRGGAGAHDRRIAQLGRLLYDGFSGIGQPLIANR